MQEGLLLTEPRANGLESRASRLVTLFDALYDFQEHRRCGGLDGGVEGDRVWMTCMRSAVIVRALDPAAP